MLNHAPFYNSIVRKIVVVFGSMFNELDIVRKKANSTEVERFRVPIAYGPKEKYLARVMQDPELDQEVQMVLPRMSFELSGVTYDPTRKLISTNTNVFQKNASEKYAQYVPVPYDININLSLMYKEMDDGLQVVEQILPFFKPQLVVPIKTIPELNLIDDVPFVLNSATNEDPYEGPFEDRRVRIWTFNFTIKANFYQDIDTLKLIKKVQVDALVTAGDVHDPVVRAKTPRVVRVTVTPDPPTAGPDDAWTPEVEVEEFNDQKKYDPVDGEDHEIEE